MNLQEYIAEYYDNRDHWFVDEVKQPWHMNRVSKVINNKSYLRGIHKVLERENAVHKGKEYVTRKIVLQIAKTILNFHSTYLLGKPVSLTGSESMVKEYNKIYRLGNYNGIDYKIIDRINKFADCAEYLYWDNGIKSKVLNPEDSYFIYDDEGNYIGFIEHYISDNVYHYNVFYPDRVEQWNNKDGELQLIDSRKNISGLPIHYHNLNDDDENFGRSELDDIVPILNEMEDNISKFADAIYTLSLNPIPTVIGQRIESTIPADAIGYSLNLEEGADLKIPATMLDYNSIKLLYDNLKQALMDVACMPSVAMGNTNVANVSEVSLKLLYQMADVKAMLNERFIREGFNKRFEVIRKVLESKGIVFGEDDYIDVEFNYSRPVNTTDIINNLKSQREMGAVSIQTIIEKSELTNNVQQEMERLNKEQGNDTGENTNNNE